MSTAHDEQSTELEQLRLRVAAQDRLLAAMLEENVDIHDLRRRNHDLEQYVGRILALPGVRGALKARRWLLGRPTEPMQS